MFAGTRGSGAIDGRGVRHASVAGGIRIGAAAVAASALAWCRRCQPLESRFAAVVATYAPTNLGEELSWRGALLFGGIPMFWRSSFARRCRSRDCGANTKGRTAAPGKARGERRASRNLPRASLKYFLLGALMCGTYIVSYQAIRIFTSPLMIRDLRANADVVRSVTLIWCLFLGSGDVVAGASSFPAHCGRCHARSTFGRLSGRTAGFMCCWVIKTGTRFRSIEQSRDTLSHLGCHATRGSPTTWRTIS
jgi:hypothetical protein